MALGLLGAMLAAWSVFSLGLEYVSYRQIALTAGISGGADRQALLDFQKTSGSSGAGSCSRDLMRAQAALGIYLVETGRPADERTREAALLSVERALACRPYDGMAWLQLSFLYGLEAGPTEASLQALDMSIWTAPNELHVIRRRIALASTMYASGADALAGKLENDIRKVVQGARTDRIASLYVRAPDLVKPIYERHFSGEPQVRRTRLQRDIVQARKHLGAAANPAGPKP